MTTMTAVIFDTHSFIKKLTAVGMPEKQAEVLADEQAHLLETQIATKRDLKELQVATQSDIKELKFELETSMANLKAELIRWVLSVAGVQVAFMTAIMTAFKFL